MKAEDSTHSKTDTISQKVINIYLAKGIEARKLVLVLRKQIFLDSVVIATQDTIIVKYQIVNQILTESLKNKDKEIIKLIQKHKREVWIRRFFEVTTLTLLALHISK